MLTNRLRRLLVALTLTAAGALPVAVPAPAAAADTVDLVIRRDAGLTAAERSAVRADAGVAFERHLRLPDAEVVTVPAAEAAQALRDLRADPDVRWAQPDGGVSAQAVKTDPLFGLLWGLENVGQTVNTNPGVSDADMDVTEAWARSTGAGQTIAVVDTGVDAAHEDLIGRLAENAGETGTDAGGADKRSNGVDDDADGLVDNWRGWDFMYGDNDPSDVDGHGTHVAGTIAASNGNGAGITGVAPDAKVLALKALGDDGDGTWSAVADAFDYAGDRGVRIVNASLGGPGDVPLLSDVMGQHPDTLFVVAAGNDGKDLDSRTYSPCEAPQANVVCVGASDSSDKRASFSNYSPTAVDVLAPGVDVASTVPGGYAYMGGTSMATPHVAALAALLLAQDSTRTTTDLKRAIMGSAERRPALAPYANAGGRANADRALTAAEQPADGDGDGVPDVMDNCPAVANAGQADFDDDGAGDACDPTPRGPDTDVDTVADVDDNCPAHPNRDQADADADGTGDACDATPRGPDGDGDGVANMDDNCVSTPNPGQEDADRDGLGDACDPTPRGHDADRDGIGALDDACPYVAGLAEHRGCPAPAAPPPALPAPASPAPALPAPAAAPVVRSVKATSTGAARCRNGRCTRLVTFSVRAAATDAIRLTVDNRRCTRGRCAYRRVASSSSRRVRLAPGRYRVTVTATGPGGNARKTIAVTVRPR